MKIYPIYEKHFENSVDVYKNRHRKILISMSWNVLKKSVTFKDLEYM